jgi:putative RNA 2'-phosphotransferase
MKDLKNISKLLSLVLRHDPQVIGINLDLKGWADVDEIITKINENGTKVDFEILLKVVDENDKHRFSFNDDLTKIRANQGHSIDVDVELKTSIPPDVLFHGTVSKFLKTIENIGLQKMSRLHVHLSKDHETAAKVGNRRGKAIILTVDSKTMQEDGFEFYLSENNVWLCDNVPSKYINFPKP